MTRRVRLHGDFLADFERQVAWLERRAELAWIEGLEADVIRAVDLLTAYPAAGVLQHREGSVALRRLVLSSTPYLAWYVYDEARAAGDLWLVRLFHSRQLRPAPALSRWLRRRVTDQ